MTIARDLRIETPPEQAEPPPSLASWYAQGMSDEFGDRLLMFDNTGGPALELLRFRSSLTATPGFEGAVRRRVERLRRFNHPAFATVRGVEYLGAGDGLALLSHHTPGKRLSDALRQARGPAFAISLIRQLTPALAALQRFDNGIGHGALAASRIVILPDGRLMILEHVLGVALDQLQLTAPRLQSELGIFLPAGDPAVRPRFDSRTDTFQLGVIALSLLVGRPVSPEHPQHVSQLLAECSGAGDEESARAMPWLRAWLQRALQLKGQAFESSTDALNALHELSQSDNRAVPVFANRNDIESETTFLPESCAAEAAVDQFVAPDSDGLAPVSADSAESPGTDLSAEQITDTLDALPSPAATPDFVWQPLPATLPQASSECPSPFAVESWSDENGWQSRQNVAPSTAAPAASAVSVRIGPRKKLVRALIAALVVLAAGEALVIAALLNRRDARPAAAVMVESPDAGSNVLVDGRVVGVTPMQLQIDGSTRSIRVAGSASQVATAAKTPVEDPRHLRANPAARSSVGDASVSNAAQRLGRIAFVSPIELLVYEGGRYLGSTVTEHVSVSPGRHELELVNSSLGFRTRRVVTVQSGRVASVTVALPNGRVNINAVPWAHVWIDGRPLGETPVGNVLVPAGEHEIVFRHPDLGEHRQTALVRLDGITRVSVNLQR